MSKSLQGVPFIENLDLKNKIVFIRVDFNVPVVDGKITDDSRIVGAIPTIQYALQQGAKVVLGSHFGRPKGVPEDRQKYSLEVVAERLGELTGLDVLLIEEPTSEAPLALLKSLRENQILLLENLRFDPSEEKNTNQIVDAITRYANVYVNDAFGASHRAHASIVGLPQAIPQRAMGFLMKKEIEMLDTVLHSPKHPYWAVLGGAKVSDKIQIIENLINNVDGFVIGGAMAYTFLAAMGQNVGISLVEKDQISFTKRLIERLEGRGKKLLLPIDHVVAPTFNAKKEDVKTVSEFSEGQMGLDIGPKSVELFGRELKSAQTIFWNGPMGVFENPLFSKGTFEMADKISQCQGTTIVGGGDSASAARESGFAERFTHISTGGGASLEFLQGLPLPGLLALKGKWREHMGTEK